MPPNIGGQLQKTALNEAARNKERVKELVEILDGRPEQEEGEAAWSELKVLIGAAEPEKPAEGQEVIGRDTKDDEGNQLQDGQGQQADDPSAQTGGGAPPENQQPKQK